MFNNNWKLDRDKGELLVKVLCHFFTQDAQSYAESNGIDLFTELSAKSGGNTEDLLSAIGK